MFKPDRFGSNLQNIPHYECGVYHKRRDKGSCRHRLIEGQSTNLWRVYRNAALRPGIFRVSSTRNDNRPTSPAGSDPGLRETDDPDREGGKMYNRSWYYGNLSGVPRGRAAAPATEPKFSKSGASARRRANRRSGRRPRHPEVRPCPAVPPSRFQ